MKKELNRVWLIFFLITWILYMGLHFFICKVRGNEFDLLERSIIATIMACIMGFGSIAGVYFSTIRSKYLENNDIQKPTFKGVWFSVLKMSQDFDFNCLKTEIAENWIITFSDDAEKVLKFRERISAFRNWGAGAWLTYDSDAHKLIFGCFTMTGIQHDIARKMLKEIEKCVRNQKTSTTIVS